MLDALKEESNRTYTRTENDAATYASSGSDTLDFFAAAGALREAGEAEIIVRFTRAFAEHPTYALRTLFYARDVRGGLGERRLFRVLLRHLAFAAPASLEKNLKFVPGYGRWDDLLVLLDTPLEAAAVRLIRAQLEKDLRAAGEEKPVSLLAKWLPSVNTSSRAARAQARRLAGLFGLSEADYRRMLVRLRRRIALIENALRTRDYTFDYAKQPSKAMFKYRAAFWRNDVERYKAFRGGKHKPRSGVPSPPARSGEEPCAAGGTALRTLHHHGYGVRCLYRGRGRDEFRAGKGTVRGGGLCAAAHRVLERPEPQPSAARQDERAGRHARLRVQPEHLFHGRRRAHYPVRVYGASARQRTVCGD